MRPGEIRKLLYVSKVHTLPDADRHQVDKEVESTFPPDADLHQVEMCFQTLFLPDTVSVGTTASERSSAGWFDSCTTHNTSTQGESHAKVHRKRKICHCKSHD